MNQQQRWQAVQQIFSRAVELSTGMVDGERQLAVLEMCDGDETILAEVNAMLDADRRQHPLLDARLDRVARDLLDFGALPSMVQRQIGPYRLLRLLGEGGMGVVYLAERTDIGGCVAIKLLRDAWLSPMRRQRFHLEQLALAQLNHPSIARIYDSNTLEDGAPWFVMEYAEGLALTEHWKACGGTVRECVRLFQKICEAVQYAHSHAIIHRDLKPSNILVNQSGEIKLLDFGIAKQLNHAESQDQLTMTGLRMMTLAYAAPEQLSGGAVGVYTDVYALGVLLYELVTGRLPIRTDDLGADTPARDREIEKPSAVVFRELPERRAQLTRAEWADLNVLILKALQAEVSRRYGTVDALMRDLAALEQGRPLDARPPEWSYTLGKFVRRNRRPLLTAAVMFLLIVTTIGYYTVRLARARDAAVREAARTLRIQRFTESLFDGGDPSAGPALDLRVVDLLERGREEAAGLGADPVMQADVQETLGGIYQKLGNLDAAEPLLVSALAERKQALGQNHRKVAESLVVLGLLRKDQGKLEDAETLVRQGLAINQRAPSASHEDIARSLVSLGSVLEVRGKYAEAQQVLEEALKLRPQSDRGNAETAENLTELADVQFYQGHYDVSASLNQQAIAIDRRLFGEQHPAVADGLNNLGAIEYDRGNYAASESDYRQALAIAERWYGPDHPETAANLTALAQTLTSEKQLSEAQALLERALAIQKRGSGPVRSTVATTLNQLGVLAFQEKQYETAKSYFNEAIETWKKVYGAQHPFIANAISNLGSVCQEQKDYPCAEKMYREAVRRFSAVSADSINIAIARVKLGRTLLREGKFNEAEENSLAGYHYLVQHVPPSNGYLTASLKDLSAVYDALHNAELADHYRAELSSPAAGAH
jgi:serine/threonine protein kinase/tetratricopeptide (TPR) repeat protein